MFLLNPYVHATAAAPAFSPDDIATITAWWDPDDSASVTGSSPITAVAEQLGTGLDLEPAVSNSPDLVTDGGRDWMSFDSSNNEALKANGGRGAAELNFGAGEFTIFAVIKTSDSTAQGIINKGGDSGGRYLMQKGDPTGGAKCYLHDGSAAFNNTSDDERIDHDSVHVLAIMRDNSANLSRIRLDGIEVATLDITALGDIDETSTGGLLLDFLVGAQPSGAGLAAFYEGLIGEIICYEDALSSSDLEDVETYLMEKWGAVEGASPAALSAVGWWDISDSATVTLDGSSNIEQVTSKGSDAGATMAQSTASLRPLAKAHPGSGLTIGQFDASSDEYLKLGSFGAFRPGTGDFSIFCVYRRFVSSAGDQWVFSAGNDQDRYVLGVNNTAAPQAQANIAESSTNATNVADASVDYDDGTVRVLLAVRDGDTWTLYSGIGKSRPPEPVASTSGVGTWDVLPGGGDTPRIGAFRDPGDTFFNSFEGEIGEAGYFDKALSLAERRQLFRYFLDKWGT